MESSRTSVDSNSLGRDQGLNILTILKSYPSVVLSTFTLCSHHHHSAPQRVSCKTETLNPLNGNFLFSPPLSLWKPPFYFVSMDMSSLAVELMFVLPQMHILKPDPQCDGWCLEVGPLGGAQAMRVKPSSMGFFLNENSSKRGPESSLASSLREDTGRRPQSVNQELGSHQTPSVLAS